MADGKRDLTDGDARLAGTARLAVVVPVALLCFFYISILDYAIPLYFSALSAAAAERGGTFPADIWSKVVLYQVVPWIVGPVLAGLCARRYGERAVWCAALLGKVCVPLILLYHPDPAVIKLLAFWQGFTGALMWIAGVSLIQMVPADRKGISNAMLMTALGVGSLIGPVAGRILLYRRELATLTDWGTPLARLFNFEPMAMTPTVADFRVVLLLLTVTTLCCGVAIGLWGQRRGRFEHDLPPGWDQTIRDFAYLSRNARFWALVVTLCVLGGAVFQAQNQYLPYRAEDLGLKSGAADHGWIWLNLLKTLMWIPGGAAVALLAGKRASGLAGVAMLGTFSLALLGVGQSGAAWQMFVTVAVFEFVRQFMRWSHAGYLSEHLPGNLRSTAIGLAISFAGLGSVIYGWAVEEIWTPGDAGFSSQRPFQVAAVLGLIGAAGLLVFDRIHPIRTQEAPPPQSGE